MAPTSRESAICGCLERCTISDWWTPGIPQRVQSVPFTVVWIAPHQLLHVLMLELASKSSQHLSHCAAAHCVSMMDDVQALHAVVVHCKIRTISHCTQRVFRLHVQSRQSAYLVSACAEVIIAAGLYLTRCTCCSPLATNQRRRQNAWILLSATSAFALCAVCWKPVANFSTRALPRNA